MADAKSILIEIPGPESSQKGEINDIGYQWMALRTPARSCSTGEHEISSYMLVLTKPGFMGFFKKKFELTFGLLAQHNIIAHDEPVPDEVKNFLEN